MNKIDAFNRVARAYWRFLVVTLILALFPFLIIWLYRMASFWLPAGWHADKTFWDWLGLLTLPFTLLLIAFLAVAVWGWAASDDRWEKEKQALQLQNENRLQAYLENMNALILEHDLLERRFEADAPVRRTALALTTRLLRVDDPARQQIVLQFLRDVGLADSLLSGADLREIYLYQARLDGFNLCGTDLRRACLFEAQMNQANLAGANLRGAFLQKARINSADLHGADLSEAYLTKASLCDSDISKANLSSANLEGAYLVSITGGEADLSMADLSSARMDCADLTHADLWYSNLHKAHLDHARLSGARLVEVDLSEAKLSNAYLDGADCYSANLKNAVLCGAHLRQTNLQEANLSRTNLRGAYLRDTQVSTEQLAKAILSNETTLPSDETNFQDGTDVNGDNDA